MTKPHTVSSALIFGATGALGSEVVAVLRRDGSSVTAVVRPHAKEVLADERIVLRDNMRETLSAMGKRKFDAVVWAQGTNLNDSIHQFDKVAFEGLMSANLGFVMESLAELLEQDQIASPARLCVISSIWQNLARQQKMSYTVSKAAIGGFVRAASADLADRQILINAVLPGVIDTPMTRSVLADEQVRSISTATGFNRLATPTDVAEAVSFFCSDKNNAITGQSLAVDLGFSHVRKL